MKRVSITIDSETLEEITREFIAREFPSMEIANTVFPYISEFTIRLQQKEANKEAGDAA